MPKSRANAKLIHTQMSRLALRPGRESDRWQPSAEALHNVEKLDPSAITSLLHLHPICVQEPTDQDTMTVIAGIRSLQVARAGLEPETLVPVLVIPDSVQELAPLIDSLIAPIFLGGSPDEETVASWIEAQQNGTLETEAARHLGFGNGRPSLANIATCLGMSKSSLNRIGAALLRARKSGD